MRPSIRPARVEDIAALHRIRLAVRENALTDPGRVTEASYIPFLTGRGMGWVAEQGGAPLGFAILDLDEARLWALFVAPEAEGRGVGTSLLEAIRAFAATHRIARLRLGTAAGTRAARFYERCGWTLVGPAGNGDIELEWDLAGGKD